MQCICFLSFIIITVVVIIITTIIITTTIITATIITTTIIIIIITLNCPMPFRLLKWTTTDTSKSIEILCLKCNLGCLQRFPLSEDFRGMVGSGSQQCNVDPRSHEVYRKISNIWHTKWQNLNDSLLRLQLSAPNPLKPGVKSRMKM